MCVCAGVEGGHPQSVALILPQEPSLASNDIAYIQGSLAVALSRKALSSLHADMAVSQLFSLAYTHKSSFFFEPTFLHNSLCFWILGLSFGVCS